jgi:hypothetical protein
MAKEFDPTPKTVAQGDTEATPRFKSSDTVNVDNLNTDRQAPPARNPNARNAIMYDDAGVELDGEVVPVIQNAAGRWPDSLIRDDIYYDFDAVMTADHGNPVYRRRSPTSQT